MATWLIVVLVVYGIVALGFVITMMLSAPEHGTRLGVAHIVIALIWPGWALFYLWVVVDDW